MSGRPLCSGSISISISSFSSVFVFRAGAIETFLPFPQKRQPHSWTRPTGSAVAANQFERDFHLIRARVWVVKSGPVVRLTFDCLVVPADPIRSDRIWPDMSAQTSWVVNAAPQATWSVVELWRSWVYSQSESRTQSWPEAGLMFGFYDSAGHLPNWSY